MTFYSALVTLILVMDPLGNVPVFLSVLRRFSEARQRMIILRETGIAFVILVLFLFFGNAIMDSLQVSGPALSIAGALILFLIALRMIFPESGAEETTDEEPFVVPLAVPLTAGPSAIATVLLFSTQHPESMRIWFMAIVVATVFFLVVMLLSQVLMRFLGRRGLIAIERLMGMLLTAVAVQMFLSGIKMYQAM